MSLPNRRPARPFILYNLSSTFFPFFVLFIFFMVKINVAFAILRQIETRKTKKISAISGISV